MAYDHLHKADPTLDAAQVGDIVQSVMLHTSIFQRGKSSAVEMVLHLSANFDMLGFDAFGSGSLVLDSLLNRETVREIEEAYPRGDFSQAALVAISTMLVEKPNCLVSHMDPNLAQLERLTKVKSLLDVEEQSKE